MLGAKQKITMGGSIKQSEQTWRRTLSPHS